MASEWLECSEPESPERPVTKRTFAEAFSAVAPTHQPSHPSLSSPKRDSLAWAALQKKFLEGAVHERGQQKRVIRIGTACSGLGTPTRALQASSVSLSSPTLALLCRLWVTKLLGFVERCLKRV